VLQRHVPIEMAIERALAKILKTEEVPDDAVCYICMDRQGGGPVGLALTSRGCACRGPSAGFAHVASPRWRRATHTRASKDVGNSCRWTACVTCRQQFSGTLAVELGRRFWRHHRDAPASADKVLALSNLASPLMVSMEVDVAERLYEEARRDVADPVGMRVILHSDVTRACALNHVSRSRDAFDVLVRIQPIANWCDENHLLDYGLYYRFALVFGVVLAQLGRVEAALPLAAEAGALARSCYGPQSTEAFGRMYVQGQHLAKIGRIEEAKATLGHVLAMRTRYLGPDHPCTRETRDELNRIPARTA